MTSITSMTSTTSTTSTTSMTPMTPMTPMTSTTPKLMSECGDEYVIDEKYKIKIRSKDYIILHVGFKVSHAGANFKHSNIAGTTKNIFHFKHFKKNGMKYWAYAAGIKHILIIPCNKITLLPKKGYSYVSVRINGAELFFNVSGGTDGDDKWFDIIETHVDTNINLPIKTFKKLCEVAIRNSPFEPIELKQLTDEELNHWNTLACKTNSKYQKKIIQMAEEGKNPIIHLAKGYCYDGGKTIGYALQLEKIQKYFIIHTNPQGSIVYGTRVKINQIDWYKTAIANNIFDL